MKTVCDLSVSSAPRRARCGWHPGGLFGAGVRGAWYDPADLSSLFKDVAGTLPVTADGDAVALMRDKSGSGNDAAQAVAAARPRWRTDGTLAWLDFDGVDDALVTAAPALGSPTAVCVSAAIRKLDDTAVDVLIELGTSTLTTSGTWALQVNGIVPNIAAFSSRGATARVPVLGAFGTAPKSGVLTGLASLATDTVTLRVNGSVTASSATPQGGGGYDDRPIHLGARAGVAYPFRGHFYGAVIRFAASSADEIGRIETYLSAKAGGPF